jgi:hypothetical protein
LALSALDSRTFHRLIERVEDEILKRLELELDNKDAETVASGA